MVRTHRSVRIADGSGVTSEQVWREIERQSFAVISYATPVGDPRSSGVVYAAARHRLLVAVAPDSWKARHIPEADRVAVTVPVRRGGLLSLMFPIPPATISFHGRAVVHPPGSVDLGSLSSELAALVPEKRLATCRVIEIFPEGHFLTYGIGTSLKDLGDPVVAQARVRVD